MSPENERFIRDVSRESSPNSTRSRIGILRPLGIRDFKLLWLGMSVSMLGDGVFWVALAWQVYRLSDAPTALSIVGIAWTLPMVFFLLGAGLVTDRIERRRVMIFADVVRGCAVGAMGVLSVTGSIELWHLIVLSGVFGVGDAFFGPAFGAIVPDIVPPNLIVEANSLDQFVRPLSLIMLGPAVGGLTIDAFGVGQAFLLDAATFAFSGVMLLRISARPLQKKDSITFAGARAELKEGYDYARSQPWLWATLLAAGLTLLAVIGPLEVVLPHLVKYQLGGDAGDLGLIYALGGVGAIIGALVLAQRGLPQRHIRHVHPLGDRGDRNNLVCVCGIDLPGNGDPAANRWNVGNGNGHLGDLDAQARAQEAARKSVQLRLADVHQSRAVVICTDRPGCRVNR